MRTAHLLTRRAVPENGDILATLTMGLAGGGSRQGPSTDVEPGDTLTQAAGGILVGAGGPDLDHRRTALIHYSPGPGGGLFFGLDEFGHLVATDFSDGNRILGRSATGLADADSVEIQVRIEGAEGGYREETPREGVQVNVEARSLKADASPVTLRVQGLPSSQLTGGLALVSHWETEGAGSTWFSRILLEGAGLEAHPDRRLGPVLGAQHVVSRGILTLTAQLFPVSPLTPGPGASTPDSVVLELQEAAGGWIRAGAAPVVVPGYTATFLEEDWEG
jgi:hypothetical protein